MTNEHEDAGNRNLTSKVGNGSSAQEPDDGNGLPSNPSPTTQDQGE